MSTRMNVFRKIYNYFSGDGQSKSADYLNIEHRIYNTKRNEETKRPYKMLTLDEKKSELNNKVKILHKIQQPCREIKYILELAKDKFFYSPPEVVDYCFNIVERCMMLEKANIDERLWYSILEPYLI